MKKLLLTVLLFFQICFLVQASAVQLFKEELPLRKPFVTSTLLVNKKVPNGIIASPSLPAFRAMALRVQQAIKIATGATLPIVNVEGIFNQRGEFIGAGPSSNVITLGSLQNNGLVAHLYFRGYCGVNTNYPGLNGYVVQTVCDPWGNGLNAIILGGSTAGGVEKAVQRFCSELPKSETLNLPRTLRAVVQGKYDAPDPINAEREKILENAAVEFKAGKHNGLFPLISGAGMAYNLSGKEGQARLFRDMLFLEYDLRRTVPLIFDSPWGGGADMQFAPLMSAWDNVEESPSLSDTDRKKITDIILEYIHYYETYPYMPYFKTSGLRHNHHTFPGQGFSAAGRYFTKYYPGFADGNKWLKMGDDCFRVQQTSWKTLENSSAYVGLATRHMCYYATTRPDFTWFDSGRANLSGDLAIMTMDNLGSQCAFGDMEGYSPTSHFELWNNLVAVKRDGRYSWALHKARNAIRKAAGESDSVIVQVAPVEPTDLLGVKFMGIDSLFYATLNGSGQNAGKVARQESFDKLTFRSSFDPQSQYLAIDGINIGYHSHRDGNSVLRLSDHGRIWLADGDYIKASAKYHNTLLIFKNGQATGMPPFIRRDVVADLPGAGITRTTMTDYGGTDWSRNIIWDKGRAFVFIDEVKANETESYSVRTLWHTLGKPSLNNNVFSLSQQGESFAIRNLDGSQLRMSSDSTVGKNWASYKYADPMVHTLQQIRTTNLRKGDKLFVINVMSAQADGKAPVTAARVNDSTLVLGSGADRALIGVGDLKLQGISTDAQLYRVTSASIELAGTQRLTAMGRKFFEANKPLSVELSGNGIALSADEPTKMTFFNVSAPVLLDGKPVKPSAGTLTIALSAGKHHIKGITFPKNLVVQFPATALPAKNEKTTDLGTANLIAKAQFTPANARDESPFAADGKGTYVAGTDGVLYALTNELKSRWTYKVGGNIRAVWTGKLGKNDPERIVAGNKEGRIVVLDQDGKLVWEQQVPLNRKTREVKYFTSADLKGDGNRALIAGSQNWYNYAYDISGKLIWNYMCTHGARVGGAFDLNGDGKEEVLSGTEYYTWGVLNPDNGVPLWTVRGGPGAFATAAADLRGDRKPMVFFGGADGYLYAVNADGKRAWMYSTGDGSTCIEFLDVNNDGKQDVLTGTLSGDLVALDADGKTAWRKDIGEPVLSMIKTDVDGDGKAEIVIGTTDGHVIALKPDGTAISNWTATGAISKLVAIGNGRIAAGTATGQVAILSLK